MCAFRNFQREADSENPIKIEKSKGSFGFHLWFDQDGHFIEDVTIGSPADKAGLKVHDRLVKVGYIGVYTR